MRDAPHAAMHIPCAHHACITHAPRVYLRDGHVQDGLALLPLLLPAVEHAVGEELQAQAGDEREADAPSRAGKADRQVRHHARALVQREHGRHLRGVVLRELGLGIGMGLGLPLSCMAEKDWLYACSSTIMRRAPSVTVKSR